MRQPALPSPDRPSQFLTASEAVAWIASALRLANVRGGTGMVSEATTKRVASANAHVSPNKTAAVLNGVLDGLYTDEYLRALGLDEGAAANHRLVVVAGMEGALATWDRFVASLNLAQPAHRPALAEVAGSVYLTDIAVRAAAYLAAFGHVVPAVRRLLDGAPVPSIAEALQRIRSRVRRKVSDAELLRAAKIDRNTLRDLARGRRLPREETILALARGLAKLGVREADHDATAEELEFELRVACLASCLRDALNATPELHEMVAYQLGRLRFYLSDLRRYSAVELAEIVACGVSSARWADIHARLSRALTVDMVRMMGAMNAAADRWGSELLSSATEDASKPLQMLAEWSRNLAKETRESVGRVPGWERSAAGDFWRFFEQFAEMWSALAEGREPPPAVRLGETFRAKSLCFEVAAPWNDLTREQMEDIYCRAVELDPACAYVRVQYADFLLAQDAQSGEAERHLDVAVMLDETYDEARVLLAGLLVRNGKHSKALEHVETLRERLGPTPEVLTVRGRALLGLEQADLASKAFSEALDLAPRHVPAHLGRARALRALGDLGGARRHEQAAALFAGERSPRPTAVNR